MADGEATCGCCRIPRLIYWHAVWTAAGPRTGARCGRSVRLAPTSPAQGAPCLGLLRLFTASSRRMTCAAWSERNRRAVRRRRRRRLRAPRARRRVRQSRDRSRHAGEFAVACRGFADGVRGTGTRRGADRAGVHRSAVLRVGSAGLSGCDVHRQPQPRRIQRHQAVPRGAKPVGKDTGLSAISEDVIAGVPAYDGARARSRTATCWPTTASSCARW